MTSVEGQDYIGQSIKAFFFEHVQATKTARGARKRVCGPQTVQMRWNAPKYFSGYLEDGGLLDDLPKQRAHPAALLSSAEMLKAYYAHLEQDATCRGAPFSPGVIQLATRSLAVLMQACWDGFFTLSFSIFLPYPCLPPSACFHCFPSVNFLGPSHCMTKVTAGAAPQFLAGLQEAEALCFGGGKAPDSTGHPNQRDGLHERPPGQICRPAPGRAGHIPDVRTGGLVPLLRDFVHVYLNLFRLSFFNLIGDPARC